MLTDASNYAWAGELTQPYDEINPSNPSTDNKPTKSVHHPIMYVSGLFRGSQLNWVALTKEAYVSTCQLGNLVSTSLVQIYS